MADKVRSSQIYTFTEADSGRYTEEEMSLCSQWHMTPRAKQSRTLRLQCGCPSPLSLPFLLLHPCVSDNGALPSPGLQVCLPGHPSMPFSITASVLLKPPVSFRIYFTWHPTLGTHWIFSSFQWAPILWNEWGLMSKQQWGNQPPSGWWLRAVCSFLGLTLCPTVTTAAIETSPEKHPGRRTTHGERSVPLFFQEANIF